MVSFVASKDTSGPPSPHCKTFTQYIRTAAFRTPTPLGAENRKKEKCGIGSPVRNIRALTATAWKRTLKQRCLSISITDYVEACSVAPLHRYLSHMGEDGKLASVGHAPRVRAFFAE